MKSTQSTKTLPPVPGSFGLPAFRHYLTNKRVLLAAIGVVFVAAAAFNWNWLVAAGIASILLSILPCLVMCGLGLCMHKMMNRSGASQPSQDTTAGSIAASSDAVQSTAATHNMPIGAASCCAGHVPSAVPNSGSANSQVIETAEKEM